MKAQWPMAGTIRPTTKARASAPAQKAVRIAFRDLPPGTLAEIVVAVIVAMIMVVVMPAGDGGRVGIGRDGRADGIAEPLHRVFDIAGRHGIIADDPHRAARQEDIDLGDAGEACHRRLDLGRAGGAVHAADAVFRGGRSHFPALQFDLSVPRSTL